MRSEEEVIYYKPEDPQLEILSYPNIIKQNPLPGCSSRSKDCVLRTYVVKGPLSEKMIKRTQKFAEVSNDGNSSLDIRCCLCERTLTFTQA